MLGMKGIGWRRLKIARSNSFGRGHNQSHLVCR